MVIRRLVSPLILESYADGAHRGSVEAATLFVDAAGFTSMMNSLTSRGRYGAEVAAQVMTAVFSPLVDAVYSHRGVITAFAGDAFTAIFPPDDAAAAEGAAMQALAAAAAMREHLEKHPSHETPWGWFEIGMKIGLAAGTVRWSILDQGSGGRAVFYLRGTGIDRCAAADAYNEPGGLVLHPSARALLGDAVVVTAIADAYSRVIAIAAPLPGPVAPDLAPVDAAALAAFVPREIVEQTDVGEYRQVVNVFVNLHGDPEDAALHSVTTLIWDLQATHGGQLNRIDFGDKGCNLLLYWGVPQSREDDAARALNFLLELRRAAPMPLRAGVTMGVSHAGFVGSELHAEFTCYGRGINLAARLMTAAPWGEVWLDEAVQRRAAHAFSTTVVGDRTFKGIVEPIAVFSLGDPRTDIERHHDGEMVGRTGELDALIAFVASVGEGGCPSVVVIEAEAGMGKSRLVSALLDSVAPIGATGSAALGGTFPGRPHRAPRPIVAPSDSINRGPFHPFRYWLRNYFARNPRAPDSENKATFDRRLDALLDDLRDPRLQRDLHRRRSVLGALVDLHWDDSLYARLDPAARFDHTLDAITNLLLAESRRQPVILVLEDAHWIDAGSAEVIRRLVHVGRPAVRGEASSGADGSPIAVIVTARPGDVSVFPSDVEHETVLLRPFERSDLATLAARILPGSASSDLLDLLMARTDGNPFFAEQLVLFLRDTGKLVHTDEGWSMNVRALAGVELPVDVQVIFVAQLDRLGQTAREVAQAASVLGREFNRSELIELLAQSGVAAATVMEAIEAGTAARIWQPVGASRHTFRHVLLRDAAYEMQIVARRAYLHHHAALALERVWAGNLEPHYGDISHQYEAACHLGVGAARQPAAQYLTKAGVQAATTFASAAAADLFTRALALIDDDDVEARFELLIEREGANDLRCDRPAQLHDIEALEELGRRTGRVPWMAEAAIRRAYVSSDLGDLAGALAASDRTLALASEAGLAALESTSLRTGGAALRAIGRFDEAAERFERSIAVAEAAHLDYQSVTAWTAWSSLAVRRGRWREAAEALERVVATFESLGLVVRLAHTLNDLGLALTMGGRLAEAEARFERALALVRDVGDRAGQIRPLSNLAIVSIARQDFDRADSLTIEAGQIADQIGDTFLGTRARMIAGRSALLGGKPETARRLLADAQRAARDEFPEWRPWVAAHLAALSLHDGHCAAAIELAAEAVELARAVDDRADLLLGLTYLSRAYELDGQSARAVDGYREIIEIEQAMSTEAGRTWDALAGLARCALADGRPTAAAEHVGPIADHLEAWLASGGAGHGLGGCEQPSEVYDTVAQVLTALGDSRVTPIPQRSAH